MTLKKLGESACLVLLFPSVVSSFQSRALPSLEGGCTVKPEQSFFQGTMSNNCFQVTKKELHISVALI